MRTAATRALTVIGLSLLGGACRDEQAGPPVRVRPLARAAAPATHDAAPGDLTFRSGATFAGGAIVYLGSKLSPPQPRAGAPVTLAHYFRADRPPPEGYALFVHVVDTTTGQMLVNADHALAGGLESWPVGKVIEDVHTLTVPTTPARVLLGFWRDDLRLPVDDRRHHDGAHRALGPLLQGAGSDLPAYTAVRARRAPVIDGALNDPAWQAAEPVILRQSFDGRPASLRTEARIVYDDTHLYVAFDLEDPDVWGTYRQRDDPLYEQEVVELFLDANGDGRTYNELQVSPHNVVFDAYFAARRQGMDLSFDSGVETAVRVRGTLDDPSDRDEGWSVELRLPFARLAEVPRLPPREGDRWRFNLYRLEHRGRRQVEGQALSPLFVGDFHALPRFGWLVFGP